MKYFLLTTIAFLLFTGLKPKKTYDISPADFGLKYKEYEIETKDNYKLKAWLFLPPRTSGTTVLICHDGEGNMQKTIEKAGFFMSMGYKVLTYDYRGFGESDDFDINEKFFIYAQFQKDLDAVIDFADNQANNTRVYLYGKGMGAGLSLATGANSRKVQKVIADSPYKDLISLQAKFKTAKSEDILIPLAYDKYLIIYGGDDEIYDKSDMKDLSKIQKDNTELEEIKKADYSSTYSNDKTAYFKIIEDFLSK
jgi:cephalosporin-C deacetylase-like acetyl esterase